MVAALPLLFSTSCKDNDPATPTPPAGPGTIVQVAATGRRRRESLRTNGDAIFSTRNVLVIEDEALAAEGLMNPFGRYDPGLRVMARLDSVEETVRRLRQHPAPELVLLDVQLADGLCFEIFPQAPIACSIIFTTAYDDYALQAFQVLSKH